MERHSEGRLVDIPVVAMEVRDVGAVTKENVGEGANAGTPMTALVADMVDVDIRSLTAVPLTVPIFDGMLIS